MSAELTGLDDAAALACLRAACARGERDPITVLNLAIARDRAGDSEPARRLMQGLAALLPDWDEPPLRLAESLRRHGEATEAAQAYAAVLAINPRRMEALVASAALSIQRGDGAGAQTLLLRALEIDPCRAEAWDALGLARMLTAEWQTAAAAFVEAHRLAPRVLSYALHLVEAAHRAGSLEAELTRLEQSADADPLNSAVLAALGLALEHLGRRAEAIDTLETACAIVPDAVGPAALAGRLMARANRLRDAEATLRRATELDGADHALRNDHAAVLMRLQRHAAARTKLETILQDGRREPSVLSNHAMVLVSLGRQDEGESAAREAIALDPSAPLFRRTLANVLSYRTGVTGAALLCALRDCGIRLPRAALPDFANTQEPRRRLRIGLLSGSLRAHPVGWLTVAGFEALDPAHVQIVCLAQNAATDPIARRFRALAAEWHDIDTLDDPALARLARDRSIDVLIDLGGYGESGRMTACAYRLAPVQVKWVGMQTHSTGLAEIDWFLSDRWETPPELERFYSERILRLPDGYVCYSPPAYSPDVGPLSAVANGFVTFGCFNNLAKVTPEVIDAWCRILGLVASSKLVLKTYQFSEPESVARLRAEFTRRGIGAERLELRGSSIHREFMAEYNQIDLVLDPFPYSGGLTTCEALWMGVPTVTLPAETFASRHSTSHLSNVGLGDWVATDLDDYVRLAVARAGDVDTLAALRAGLRARVKASPLCDAPRFGRNLGAALRHAWIEWCNGAGAGLSDATRDVVRLKEHAGDDWNARVVGDPIPPALEPGQSERSQFRIRPRRR